MSTERERLEEIGKKIKRESDGFPHMAIIAGGGPGGGGGRRHNMLQGVSGGATLNTITPCAACKLLRRRCAQECPFSPYFSPHEPQKFASVHKVFGASNVSKMLMEVPESQRADAANSLVYEANVRLRDPVYGCMGAISSLQQQVQLLQAELNAIRTEILRYKYNSTNRDTNMLPAPPQITLLSSGAVSIAAPPPPPPPPPPPLPPLMQSSSPMYTTVTSNGASEFTIPAENNITYFG